MSEVSEFFLSAYKNASVTQIIIESIVFVFGIISVWLAKKENVLAYPTGLIATVFTTYLMYKAGYLGDMIVNAYYSVMSFYGWYKWSKMSETASELTISRSNAKQKLTALSLFGLTIVVIFAVYSITNTAIGPENYLDIFITGLFFSAMYFMALKKIENWTLWIIGDAIACVIYAKRGLGILSLQYVIFTILAVMAYAVWRKALNNTQELRN